MTVSAASASYETRLNRVVDYIYDHLEEDIRLDRLAEVACLSPYHWHRIYAASRGETVATTVKRLRLHRAALCAVALPGFLCRHEGGLSVAVRHLARQLRP